MAQPVSRTVGFCALGILCFLSVALTSDPLGNYPWMPEGPGLTLDESFNVQQGVYLVEVARKLGPFAIFPENVGQVFNPENGFLPDHPPFGRLWLGIWHHIAWIIAEPMRPASTQVVIACGRIGSAAAFGITIAIIGIFTSRWFGFPQGLFACLCYLTMPRIWGHASIASLETILNLTYFLASAIVIDRWRQSPPSLTTAIATGALLGLALLTKIQAFFIPVPIIVWALWMYRGKAILPLAVYGATALLLFFAGWPWLWLDPITHLKNFLSSSTDRAILHVFYLGQIWNDRAAPWHYPWVMTAVTIPLLTLLASFLGCIPFRQMKLASADESTICHRRLMLLAGQACFPLLIFSLPVARYDGVRLFLVASPFLAVLAGVGWGRVADVITRWFQKPSSATVNQTETSPKNTSIVMMATIAMFIFSSCWWSLLISDRTPLSTYNLLGRRLFLNGLLEDDYWGFELTRSRWLQAASANPDQPVVLAVAPELHQFQIPDLNEQQGQIIPGSTPGAIRFVSLEDLHSNPEIASACLGLVTFRRLADPIDSQKLIPYFDPAPPTPGRIRFFTPKIPNSAQQ